MAKLSTLTDNFSADVGNWQHTGGGALNAYEVIGSGVFTLTVRSAYDAHPESSSTFDFDDSRIACEIVSRPAAVTGTEAYFGVTLDSNNYLNFIMTGSGGLLWEQVVGGSTANSGFTTYSTTNHKYLAIRKRGSIVYFESSTDGKTWTILGRYTAGFTMTAIRAFFQAGDYNSNASPGTFVVDNVNLEPTSPAKVLAVDTANSATTSAAVTTTAAYPAGSSVLVHVAARNTSGTPSDWTVTDSAGNTYARDAATVLSAGTGFLIFSAHNIAALTAGQSVTATGPTGTNRVAVTVLNVAGLEATSTLDKTSVNPATGAGSNTATTYSSGATATLAQADEFLFGAVSFNNTTAGVGAVSNTSGWGFLAFHNSNSGAANTNAASYVQHQVTNSTAAKTSNPTGGSQSHRAGIATYRIAASAPAPTNQFFHQAA